MVIDAILSFRWVRVACTIAIAASVHCGPDLSQDTGPHANASSSSGAARNAAPITVKVKGANESPQSLSMSPAEFARRLRALQGRALLARRDDGQIVGILFRPGTGVDDLLKQMPPLPSVEQVDFQETEISHAGVQELIKKVPSVRVIDMRGCIFLDCQAAKVLADLKHLDAVYIGWPSPPQDEANCWKLRLGDRVRIGYNGPVGTLALKYANE